MINEKNELQNGGKVFPESGIYLLPKFVIETDYFADEADGTLKTEITEAGQPVKAYIEKPPAGANDTGAEISVQCAVVIGNTVGQYIDIIDPKEYPPGTLYPLEFDVPIQKLPSDGQFSLRYAARVPGGLTYSEGFFIIKDSIPPYYRPGTLPPPAVQEPAVTITQDLLDNNSEISFRLTSYDNYDVKDQIFVFLEDHVPVESEVVGLTPVYQGLFPTDLKFNLSADIFEKIGSGDRYLCYVLQDKAGNRNYSFPKTLHIALGEIPMNLEAPEVPSASNGYLSLKDVSAGPVKAFIPLYNSPEAGADILTLYWGSEKVGVYNVNPNTSFPMETTIPQEILKSQYDQSIGGQQELSVFYTLSRSSGLKIASDSLKINTDFSIVGPDLPNWPDPVNPGLPVPAIMGVVSGKTNELDISDNSQNAKFSVRVYDNASTGDAMDVFWGNQNSVAVTYLLEPGDTAGSLIELDVPWQVIEAAGNNDAVKVFYGIYNPATPDNKQFCESVDVRVSAVSIPAPAMPAYPTQEFFLGKPYINCFSLRRFTDGESGVPVLIPSLDNSVYKLQAGSEITLTWQPYDKGSPVSGATIIDKITLDETMIKNGFTWEVKPYSRVVNPIYNLGDKIFELKTSFSFIVDGNLVSSDFASVGLTMRRGDNTICPVPSNYY